MIHAYVVAGTRLKRRQGSPLPGHHSLPLLHQRLRRYPRLRAHSHRQASPLPIQQRAPLRHRSQNRFRFQRQRHQLLWTAQRTTCELCKVLVSTWFRLTCTALRRLRVGLRQIWRLTPSNRSPQRRQATSSAFSAGAAIRRSRCGSSASGLGRALRRCVATLAVSRNSRRLGGTVAVSVRRKLCFSIRVHHSLSLTRFVVLQVLHVMPPRSGACQRHLDARCSSRVRRTMEQRGSGFSRATRTGAAAACWREAC